MAKVPVVTGRSAPEIDKKAEELVRNLYPDAWVGKIPVPVDHFFEIAIPRLFGIRTMYTPLQQYGIIAEGYTNAQQKLSLVDQSIADDFSATGRRRLRSTAGHEGGHCILHVPLNTWQQSLQLAGKGMMRERSTLRAFEDPEWQAWRFCLAFCMPSHLAKDMASRVGIGYQGILAMSDYFDMNMSFVKARLRSLGIIPRDSCSYLEGYKYAKKPR